MIIDFIPSPVYRLYCWIKERPRNIKWWIQRANGKMPECDGWNYHDTLILNIHQGLTYLLREDGYVDFHHDKEHQKMYKELSEALEWTQEYIDKIYNHFYIISDEKEKKESSNEDIIIFTNKEWKEFEKKKQKTFKILADYLFALWD